MKSLAFSPFVGCVAGQLARQTLRQVPQQFYSATRSGVIPEHWPSRESRSLALMADPTKPPTRPLDATGRALLDHLLTPDFKGVEALRAQATQAEVVIQDQFPGFIELYVPATAPPATDVYRNPVTETFTTEGPGAHISLWLDGVAAAPGDYLASVEVMWMDDPWPDLPSPAELDPASLVR